MRSDRDDVYDQLLVTRCQRGDSDALQELVRRWQPHVLYFVRRIVDAESDAWDVVQKTWLRVVRHIRSLRDPRRFPSWLYRIARNTAWTHARRRSTNHVPLDGDACVDSEPDEQTRFDDAEAVHHALGRLPLPQREILTLFFLDDLSIRDIATVLSIPPGTVKSRLHYAKRCMRTILEEGS